MVLACVFAIQFPASARAAGVRIDAAPSLDVQEEWNSNVYNASENEVSSFGTRIIPTLGVSFLSPDNVVLRLSGSYDKIWYNKSEAKNAETNTWYFRADSSGAWRLTPTFSVLPSVYYLNTTDSYRRSQLAPGGDPTLPPVSITNYGTTKTYDFGGGLHFEYLVSPRTSLGLTGRYGEHRNASDNVAGASEGDSTQAGGDLSVTHQLSPRTKIGLLVAGSHMNFSASPDADVYSAGVIYGYQFTEALRFDITIGASHIRQQGAPGAPDENKTSPSGYFNLAYSGRTWTATLYGSGLYSGLSGYGQPTREGTVGLGLSGALAREWGWNLGGRYQISKSVFNAESVDTTTRYANAGVSYRPWEWGSLNLRGQLERQTTGGQFGSAIDNYSAILGFTIGKAYNIY